MRGFGANVVQQEMGKLAPGFIDTPMTRDTAVRVGIDFEEMLKKASATLPMRRVGKPVDVANVIAFLVSDEASYVTGEVICVGGGERLTK